MKENNMKKASKIHEEPEQLGKYDLSKGVRGKYAGRVGPETEVVVQNKPAENGREDTAADNKPRRRATP
jgi:hypothetical protein